MMPSTNERAVTATDALDDPFCTDALLSRDRPPATVEAVLDDHAALVGAAKKLRDLCVAASRGATVAWTRPIEEFRARLLTHFAAEETDDFFGGSVGRPALLGRVHRLQAEHAELAFAAECLLSVARTAPRRSDLYAGVIRFLDRFEVHEHAENALLQEVLLTDDGDGG